MTNFQLFLNLTHKISLTLLLLRFALLNFLSLCPLIFPSFNNVDSFVRLEILKNYSLELMCIYQSLFCKFFSQTRTCLNLSLMKPLLQVISDSLSYHTCLVKFIFFCYQSFNFVNKIKPLQNQLAFFLIQMGVAYIAKHSRFE